MQAAFGNPADAAEMMDASLDHLAATDWASLGTRAHGEMLARLHRAQAKLTALNAAVLAAFTAQSGYQPDGHRSARAWLISKTGISKGAAGSSVGWQKRLARHRRIATVMAAGDISESWAREIADWTDRLPAQKRDEADEILLDAAAYGLPLEDLAMLARKIDETWKAQHPDPDDGNGETGDEDGFEDRYLRLGTTLDGVGTLTGDLTAGCATALQAIFDSLGKHLRTRQLGVPYSGKPLPLDMGRVKNIPDHLRRAVILRDRHCAWPGGCDKPAAGCQVHHVVFRSRGGKTRLSNLVLLCSYHHQVCIHRLGWTLILHADGTTEARSPDGKILRSHGPPTAGAG